MRFPLWTFMILGGLLVTPHGSLAQIDSSVATALRAFDPPYFTYGSGLGMTSPDSLYKLTIRFRMQNRVGMLLENGEVAAVQANVQRLRLRLDGFIYTPRLRYVLQLGFATEDILAPSVGYPSNILRDAMISYSPDDHWTLGFGQGKLPGNREEVTSSGDLQLVDRSAASRLFNLDRDFGIQAVHSNLLSGNALYVLKGAVSTGEGRNWLASPGMHLCYTARAELLPFGAFTKRGDYFQGDLVREQSPKLSLGLVYSFNNKALRSAGQRGGLLYDARNITTYMADALLKYDGWAFAAEFLRRHAPDPVTRNPDAPEEFSFVYNGSGVTLQASYLFASDYELAARYSTVIADQEIREFASKYQDFITLGGSKYLRGHRLKVQFDATYGSEFRVGAISASTTWNIRGQIELGI